VEDVVVFTESEIIYKGLRLVRFGSRQIKRAKRKTNTATATAATAATATTKKSAINGLVKLNSI
jgi:hypothetical protein